MSKAPQFYFDFKRTIELTLRGVRRLSFHHFNDEYEFEDFFERAATKCRTQRELALSFAVQFLDAVPADYANALSMALVNFLAERSGRKKLD